MALVEAEGIEVERLRGNRLTGLRGENDRQTYARAKATMAIVVSPPSRRKLQPIAPSADWRFDLAEGCPAHCQYCYLAGSLSGPPVTRVYADLDDILAGLGDYVGRGTITSRPVTTPVEGGTSSLPDRLTALRRLAQDGYPVGVTIAPIIAVPDWRTSYGDLLDDIADAVRDVPHLDLTAELITHRFTPGSKEVLLDWYPHTKLEMDEAARSRKHGKFGAVKYVYPAATMAELRSWFYREIAERLPSCRILYWT
jgi:DNA repair photolyase